MIQRHFSVIQRHFSVILVSVFIRKLALLDPAIAPSLAAFSAPAGPIISTIREFLAWRGGVQSVRSVLLLRPRLRAPALRPPVTRVPAPKTTPLKTAGLPGVLPKTRATPKRLPIGLAPPPAKRQRQRTPAASAPAASAADATSAPARAGRRTRLGYRNVLSKKKDASARVIGVCA